MLSNGRSRAATEAESLSSFAVIVTPGACLLAMAGFVERDSFRTVLHSYYV